MHERARASRCHLREHCTAFGRERNEGLIGMRSKIDVPHAAVKQHIQKFMSCTLLDGLYLQAKKSPLTEPFEVSTDHPICRPSPPKVSRNRNQLLFVSSTWCSPSQSSSLPSGESTSFSSGSTSEDMRVGMPSLMNSTCGRPGASAVGRPSESEVRPKETSLGRGRGREAVSSLGGSRGEARGEGESAPSGREEDMLAGAARIALWRPSAQATWTSRVAYRSKGPRRT